MLNTLGMKCSVEECHNMIRFADSGYAWWMYENDNFSLKKIRVFYDECMKYDEDEDMKKGMSF